jgi:hypothetical protein
MSHDDPSIIFLALNSTLENHPYEPLGTYSKLNHSTFEFPNQLSFVHPTNLTFGSHVFQREPHGIHWIIFYIWKLYLLKINDTSLGVLSCLDVSLLNHPDSLLGDLLS